MSAFDQVADWLTRHQVHIQRRGKGIYQDARPEVERLYKRIARQVRQGDETAVLIALSQVLARGYDKVARKVVEELKEFGIYESQWTAQMLEGVLAVSTKLPAADALADSMTNRRMRLVSGKAITTATLDELIQGHTRNQTNQVRLALREGYLRGDTNEQLVGTLELISNRARHNLEATVLTATNHIGNVARDATYQANASVIKHERWLATLDSRTTLTCMGRDQKLYPLGGGDYPPAHFRCRSVRIPVLEIDALLPGLEGERASADGPVDAKTSYNSWLKRQPKDFQEDVLGVERARLFRSGKLHLDRFTDDLGRPYTLDELKAQLPASFTPSAL